MMQILKSNGALRISLIYIFLAGTWISTSDLILGWLITDPHVMATVSMAKGWFFITVTALVLYASLAREFAYRQKIEADIRKLNTDLEQRVQARTKQLSDAYAEMESFSYSVSHDLRAPLRSIDGFSQIILEDYADRLDETGQKGLRNIRAASRRMAEIMDALLQLSRLSRKEMEDRELNLSLMAGEVMAELQAADPTRVVEWVLQPGMMARGDPAQMRIALGNLLQNAWKFSANQIKSRIEFSYTQQDGETVFQVRDNGAGFDMAYADKLFAPFQRLHGPAEFDGTGIGLTMVQRIIRRHGGRVWATGAVGQGAVISFTL
jgi:signal transduction histidine kinase